MGGEERIPKNARHRVERTKARARYDRATVHAILDAGMLAHVAFCVGGQPFAIPMLYAREGDAILLHGSVASRLMGQLGEGAAACVSVTTLGTVTCGRPDETTRATAVLITTSAAAAGF
jgi:nitroimidazol reductase NimA-like FMN-containing flavoprotein (pyridoxamine 5'-phosphate oxidase superfamily)